MAGVVIHRMPHPALLACAAHKAPPLIHLGCLSLVDDDLTMLRINALEQSLIDVLSC